MGATPLSLPTTPVWFPPCQDYSFKKLNISHDTHDMFNNQLQLLVYQIRSKGCYVWANGWDLPDSCFMGPAPNASTELSWNWLQSISSENVQWWHNNNSWTTEIQKAFMNFNGKGSDLAINFFFIKTSRSLIHPQNIHNFPPFILPGGTMPAHVFVSIFNFIRLYTYKNATTQQGKGIISN